MDNSQENTNYSFAIYVASLVNKIQEKEPLSAGEQETLDTWREADALHESLYHQLMNRKGFIADVKQLKAYDTDDAVNALFKKLDIRHRERLVTPLVKRWLSVAAAFILLAGGAWFMMYKGKSPAPAVAYSNRLKNDIPPGGDKAILTLGDGTAIVLDSAHNGQLAQQGNTKVVNKNGRIAYAPNGNTGAVVYNTMTTPRGGQYQLTLPDGSQVWLNAASSIRYPTAFTGRERKVEINGEAYFEIVKNPAMPFKVDVVTTPGTGNPEGKLEVEVLGTHFNIMAYRDDSSVNTTLLEGKVRLTKGNVSTIMAPGQALIAGQGGSMKLVADANVQKAVAWKDGKFLFEDDDITTIMKQLSRWYNINVRMEGIINDHYTGKISRQVNISQVLKMLEAAGGMSFSVEGKEVSVSRKPL